MVRTGADAGAAAGADAGGRPAAARAAPAGSDVNLDPAIDSPAIDAALGDDLARAALALARSFAAGATLWCLAPAWPEHARHVAVEFVHPVIMGKRALPAVSVVAADPVADLRATARAGDILLAVSAAATASVRRAMRRAPAWGLTSVWVGAGERPEPGAADHVLWLDEGLHRAVRRPARPALPRAVGAHPCLLRAPWPAQPRSPRRARGRCASPAPTKAARPTSWPPSTTTRSRRASRAARRRSTRRSSARAAG